MNADSGIPGPGRVEIIRAVQTPLGFFTLVVLIVEVILGLLASRATGWDFSFLLGSMVVLVFVLVLSVFTTARRHEALAEQVRRAKDDIRSLRQGGESADSLVSQFRQQNDELRKVNSEMADRLARADSLRIRLWAILHHSETVPLTLIYRELGAENDQSIKNAILSHIGTLIDERKVVRDTMNSGYFRALRQ